MAAGMSAAGLLPFNTPRGKSKQVTGARLLVNAVSSLPVYGLSLASGLSSLFGGADAGGGGGGSGVGASGGAAASGGSGGGEGSPPVGAAQYHK
jgi:hypothetical protein